MHLFDRTNQNKPLNCTLHNSQDRIIIIREIVLDSNKTLCQWLVVSWMQVGASGLQFREIMDGYYSAISSNVLLNSV